MNKQKLEKELSELEERRDILLSDVKQVFKDVRGNYFLRGSGARGDFPVHDLDITVYNHKDDEKIKLPNNISNMEVEYGIVDVEDLYVFLTENLRAYPSVFEVIPVTNISKEVENILRRSQKYCRENSGAYNLVFRNFESEYAVRKYKEYGGYQYLKEMPGGKRNMQRIIWKMKVLYPEYQDVVSTPIVLREFLEKSLLPCMVVDLYLSQIKNLESGNVEEYIKNSKCVWRWYSEEFKPVVDEYIKKNIDQKILDIFDKASGKDKGSSNYRELFIQIKNFDKPYMKVLGMTLLSKNEYLSDRLYMDMWKDIHGQIVYRSVLRHLLKNPSFPIREISEKDVKYDEHLLDVYTRVKERK